MISLREIKQISDNNLKSLGKTCQDLKEIYLSWCSDLTDYGIEILVKRFICTYILTYI